MGTSSGNISKKIKDLLKGKPLQNLGEYAPDISKKIITKKQILDNLIEEETLISSFIIIEKHFNSISKGGYKGKSKKEILEDAITLEELLNMILDEIDQNTFLSKELLEKSYKIAMTSCLQSEEPFDINVFAHLLFYHLINQILKRELYDTLKNIYEDLQYSKIEKIISNLTDQIVNSSVYDLVEKFVAKEIPLTEVLNKIINETKNTTLGEF